MIPCAISILLYGYAINMARDDPRNGRFLPRWMIEEFLGGTITAESFARHKSHKI